MGKIREWFRNASLRGKILLLIVLGDILPLGMVIVISFFAVRAQTEERLIYALNQGYSQVYQAVRQAVKAPQYLHPVCGE